MNTPSVRLRAGVLRSCVSGFVTSSGEHLRILSEAGIERFVGLIISVVCVIYRI